MPSLAVVIPVFNRWTLTADCLRSLARYSPEDMAVVVADNDSEDETPAACPVLGRELFGSRFRYLRFDRNRHFGPACNAGAAVCEADLLFFLNNDTTLTEGWLPPLTEALEADASLAAVGPLLLYPDETVQHLGIVIEPAGAHVSHLYAGLPAAHPLCLRRRRFPAITGAALLLARQDFLAAGAFHEGYINGFEDVDLCLTLARQGRTMMVAPESRIVHHESQSASRHDGETANSRLLRSRHDLARYANMAAIAREDGLLVRVDPTLQPRFAVPADRHRELLAAVKAVRPLRPERCLTVLREEPFWEEGYDFAAALLAGLGRYGHALHVRLRQLCFAPSLEAAEQALRLLRAGREAGELSAEEAAEGAGALRAVVDKGRAGILNGQDYAARLRAVVNRLRGDGEDELAALYEEAAEEAGRLRAAWTGMDSSAENALGRQDGDR